MYHGGIGGGGFALIRAPNGTSEYIDFREAVPKAAVEEAYINHPNASLFGGTARCVKFPQVCVIRLNLYGVY